MIINSFILNINTLNWYLLYTASRAEKQVEQRLHMEGIEVFLPMHMTPRRWSDRVKMVEVPLFNSYIFVRTIDEVLRSLVKIKGVARIVYYNGAPAVVRNNEIENIKIFLEKARGLECEMIENDEVQIAAEPMKDLKGKVLKVSGNRLTLTIEQMGVTVSVKTDQVVKTFAGR